MHDEADRLPRPTVNGQQAIDVLKTNNSFRAVGVSLRQDRPSMDVLAKAAERLTELSGDQVVPLEDEIGKAAQKLLPSLQHRLAPLAERLASLKLPGTETVESVNQQIADLMLSDASDAPQRFGQALAAKVRLIVWCKKCWHRAEPDVADQVARYGPDTTVIDWASRLRCSACGEREVDFVVSGSTP